MKQTIESTEALNGLLKDLYKSECKKSLRYVIIIYVLSVMLFISVLISCFLLAELKSYEEMTITETQTITETYDQNISGDNANIVNGNQYNDNAVHSQT